MPKRFQTFFKNQIKEWNIDLFKSSLGYKQKMLVLSSYEMCECFLSSLEEVRNMLFVEFLSEVCVQMLVRENDIGLKFDVKRVESAETMCKYLNDIWGKIYFSIENAQAKIELIKRVF